ncbi:MAG: NgoMIV family type II restriction endonuclease [Chloroflexota bacterium]
MGIGDLRNQYHLGVCSNIIRIKRRGEKEYPNFADGDSKSSVEIAWNIVRQLGCDLNYAPVKEQTVGDIFEDLTKNFLQSAFDLLRHIRPGNWYYSTDKTAISGFEQYEHLAALDKKVKSDSTLAAIIGVGYIVKPDIVVGRYPVSDDEINRSTPILDSDVLASLTPLRKQNRNAGRGNLLLHASISCKWTIRSDRSQNTRTEALNLIRNRKGNLPHIVAVTAEPLPMRIATLALGTGDIDCVYHFALPELITAIEQADNQDQLEMLQTMIEGRRLRDISDLPFDLAV